MDQATKILPPRDGIKLNVNKHMVAPGNSRAPSRWARLMRRLRRR
jgi:hypothetical protein